MSVSSSPMPVLPFPFILPLPSREGVEEGVSMTGAGAALPGTFAGSG